MIPFRLTSRNPLYLGSPRNGGLVAKLRVLLLIAAFPARLDAQVPTHPITYRPVHEPGNTVQLRYGVGTVERQSLQSVLLQGSLEGEHVRASMGVGGLFDADGNTPTFFVSVANELRGPPFNQIASDIQGGLGYAEMELVGVGVSRQWNVYLGLAAGPWFVVGDATLVELWVAPRVHARDSRVSGSDQGGGRLGLGTSAGISIMLASELEFHVTVDWLSIGSAFDGSRQSERAFGIAVGYRH